MALAGRRRALAFTAAVALAAVGVWALASRADTGVGGAGGPGGGSRFTIASAAVTGKDVSTSTEVFVVDAQTMRLLVYSVDPIKGTLKLVAVRDISEDVRMSEFNNEHPWPEEIRSRLQTGAGEPGSSATKAEK